LEAPISSAFWLVNSDNNSECLVSFPQYKLQLSYLIIHSFTFNNAINHY